MSKKALVEAVVKHSSLSKDGSVLSKRAATKIVDVVFDSIVVRLKDTGRVRVPQIGTFYLKYVMPPFKITYIYLLSV